VGGGGGWEADDCGAFWSFSFGLVSTFAPLPLADFASSQGDSACKREDKKGLCVFHADVGLCVYLEVRPSAGAPLINTAGQEGVLFRAWVRMVGGFVFFKTLAQGWQAYGNVKRWTLAKIPTEIVFFVLCFIMAGTDLCFVLLRLLCGYEEDRMFGVWTARAVFYS